MAIKQAYAVKTVLNQNNLELKADPGEAFLVKDIRLYIGGRISRPAAYATVGIEKVTVGFWRYSGILGSHIRFPMGRAFHSHDGWLDTAKGAAPTDWAPLKRAGGLWGDKTYPFGLVIDGNPPDWLPEFLRQNDSPQGQMGTLIDYLMKKGIFKGYPVAEGETFRVNTSGDAPKAISVIYEIYEPGDISPEQENGSKSKEYLLVNYGNCGGAIKAAGDHLYNTTVNPAEFPAFPFGKIVPAKTEIDILGICASDFGPAGNDGINYSLTKYLKLVKEREVLFDEDRNGLLIWQPYTDSKGEFAHVGDGISLFGNYSTTDYREPLMFPEPLKMMAGDELNIYMTLEAGGTGQDISTEEHEIALIEKVRRIE